jgi:hypothetical protein
VFFVFFFRLWLARGGGGLAFPGVVTRWWLKPALLASRDVIHVRLELDIERATDMLLAWQTWLQNNNNNNDDDDDDDDRLYVETWLDSRSDGVFVYFDGMYVIESYAIDTPQRVLSLLERRFCIDRAAWCVGAWTAVVTPLMSVVKRLAGKSTRRALRSDTTGWDADEDLSTPV